MISFNLKIEDFPKDFQWDNGMFPPLDALTYWHFLKEAKSVVEIGCGTSTFLAARSNVNLIAIDPSPRRSFENIQYILKRVQDVDIDFFSHLQENDILFIDSSHLYEEGSDVQFLLEEVIPKLKKGVLVHIHDYFYPDDYPAEWKNWPHMAAWNEQWYAKDLEKIHEVLVVNNTVTKNHNEELKKIYDFVPKNITRNFGAVKGTSLWIKIT